MRRLMVLALILLTVVSWSFTDENFYFRTSSFLKEIGGKNPAFFPILPYTTGNWDADRYGNHRVVLKAEKSSPAIYAFIPWRRRDFKPENKKIILVDATTGREVTNFIRLAITREYGEILFEPQTIPGKYYVYYLPNVMSGRSNYPKVTYPSPDEKPSPSWLRKIGLENPDKFDPNHFFFSTSFKAKARRFPSAEIIAIQSIDEFNSFFPMEVIATRDEVATLLKLYPEKKYFLFPEDREYPIRMRSDLPYRWIKKGIVSNFKGKAQPGEFYAFQVGVWAARVAIADLEVIFSDLKMKGNSQIKIPASAGVCFNTHGIDWKGNHFDKVCPVGLGSIQAIWCGIQVPSDVPAGIYQGKITVIPYLPGEDIPSGISSLPPVPLLSTSLSAAGSSLASSPARTSLSSSSPLVSLSASSASENATTTKSLTSPSVSLSKVSQELSSTTLTLELTISGEPIPDHGDSQPEQHSRLRWLNSTIALDNEVVKPFSPVELVGSELRCLGRSLYLDPLGFPARIRSYFNQEVTDFTSEGKDILNRPIRLLIIDSSGNSLPVVNKEKKVWQKGKGRISWKAQNDAGPITVQLEGGLEFDGFVECRVTLRAEKDISLQDIRLDVPYKFEVARYMMGLGQPGGLRPQSLDWKWNIEKNQDSAWLGDVNAGLQVSFYDDNYQRPLNTNFYHLKPLIMPRSWANDGQGGIKLEERGTQEVVLYAYSGPRTMKSGEKLAYYFNLLITPFKPLDLEGHWERRYYHRYDPVEKIKETGANVINVHHATEINPFINYPFLRPQEMKAYIDKAHKLGMKVKIYYTVRELTNRAPELFALRSLGTEIFADGPGGGFSWLQEHLVDHYITGWFVPRLKDAAIINSGTSRWHNYYLEGLNWLTKNVGIDGLYIDDVAFDRTVMKRLRKILERNRPQPLIDLHSANQFNPRDGFANSANLYLEHFPYLDRLWFGEYFDYNSSPDYWLIEVSGIPFGLMGEMLQDGGNPYRGMIYGMTARLPWAGDPRPIWKVWDEFGIEQAKMYGYWSPNLPVRTNHPEVLTTVYLRPQKALVAVASWAKAREEVELKIDWEKLGLPPEIAVIEAPFIPDFQDQAFFAPGDKIPVDPAKGWLLIIRKRD